MTSKSSLISVVAAETGEHPDTVARIVDAAGRTLLTAFAECEAIPRRQRVAVLRTADVFIVGHLDPIGSPTTHGLAVSPANQWKVYSVQVDPPDNAVGADLTIDKTQTGTRVLMTAIEASTVNIAIEARVTAMEAARVTDQAALATWQNQVTTHFDSSDAAILAEATARTNADSAIGSRIDAVEAVNATQAAAITAQATAIANAEEAVAQVDERLAVQFGGTQLVRDPEFARDLTHWPGSLGDATRLIARDRSSDQARLSDMAGQKAFQLLHSDSASRTSLPVPASTAERYDLGAYYFRGQAESPWARAFVQWLNEANAQVGTLQTVDGSGAAGAWRYMALNSLAPPAGATKVRVGFMRTGGTAGMAWITGITLTRQAAADFASAAEILAVKQAQADADSAFTAYRTTMESRVGGIEGVNASQATQIADRYTRAQADSAISAAISSTSATLTNQINQRATTTAVNALTSRVTATENGLSSVSESLTSVSAVTNEASAYGRLRVSAFGTGADAGARIGLSARAEFGATATQAALFLEVLTNGTSRVSVVANQFAIVNTVAASPAVREVPFYIKDGSVYMKSALIEEATINTLHLASGAVVAGYTTTLSGSNPSTITEAQIASFTVTVPNACRGILVFDCTNRVWQSSSTSGLAYLRLNGADVRRSTTTGYDERAASTAAVNFASGANVVTLRGRNIDTISYLLDILVFKR